MARQTGIIQLTGTIGNITFYKSQDGMMAKEKTHISREKILHASCYERTRENMSEFSSANASSKLVFDMIRVFSRSASDNRFHSRLLQVMQGILKLDAYNVRGERIVGNGIKTHEGKVLLRNFNFNKATNIDRILRKPYVLNAVTGEITIAALNPSIDITSPRGATHVSLQSAFAAIGFEEESTDIEYSTIAYLPLNNSVQDIELRMPVLPALTQERTTCHFLKVEFYQEVNGVQYILNNGAYNCLELVEVL